MKTMLTAAITAALVSCIVLFSQRAFKPQQQDTNFTSRITKDEIRKEAEAAIDALQKSPSAKGADGKTSSVAVTEIRANDRRNIYRLYLTTTRVDGTQHHTADLARDEYGVWTSSIAGFDFSLKEKQ